MEPTEVGSTLSFILNIISSVLTQIHSLSKNVTTLKCFDTFFTHLLRMA